MNMRSTLLCVGFLLLPTVPAAGDEGIRGLALEELTENIQAVANLWDEGKLDDPENQKTLIAVERQLKAATYDDQSLPALFKLVESQRSEATNLYVINKLLQPLRMAKTEVIRQAMDRVLKVYNNHAHTWDFPVYKPAQLKMLQMPKKVDAAMRQRVELARQEKTAKDMVVIRHNAQVRRLTLTTIELLIRTDTPENDQKIFNMLQTAEKNGSYLYAEIAKSLAKAAGRMSEKRAKFYYESLVKLGRTLGTKQADYVCLGDATPNPTGNTRPTVKRDAPGVRLLETANFFATPARLPAQTLPKTGKGKS